MPGSRPIQHLVAPWTAPPVQPRVPGAVPRLVGKRGVSRNETERPV